jgi:hypothetical protein
MDTCLNFISHAADTWHKTVTIEACDPTERFAPQIQNIVAAASRNFALPKTVLPNKKLSTVLQG